MWQTAQPAVIGAFGGTILCLCSQIRIQTIADVVNKNVGAVFQQAGGGKQCLR